MRKLKLESLAVESFETTTIAPRDRGTVEAHSREVPFETYDVEECGDTRYFDCTYGCSVDTNCFCGPTDGVCA